MKGDITVATGATNERKIIRAVKERKAFQIIAHLLEGNVPELWNCG